MVTDEKAAEKPEAPAPSGGERPPLFSMTGWIVLIGICVVEGVIFTVVANMSKKGGGAAEGVVEVDVRSWEFDPFQATVCPDGVFHGYEARITLGVDKVTWDDEKKQKDLKEKKAKVRDTILTVMQKQPWPDVMQVPGQKQLKTDILTKLDEVLGKGVVQEVWFETFSQR